jgi:hypothetical protein
VKNIGPIIIGLALLVGGYFVYTNYLGGSVSGPTKGLPDVQAPDLPDAGDTANKGAKGAESGANWLADFFSSLSPTAWKIIALAIVASFLYWMWKEPKRRALALLIAVIALLAVIVT